jgi:hypothetical protein
LTAATGGTPPRPRRRAALAALALACATLAIAAPGAGAFGIVDFDGETTAAGGAALTQAGAHPDRLRTRIEFSTIRDGAGVLLPDGSVKDIRALLPAGVVGDPTAVPRCPIAAFQDDVANGTRCEADTAVGFARLLTTSGGNIFAPVYDLLSGPDEPALLGFHVLNASVFLHASVRTGGDYGLTIEIPNVSQSLPVFGTELTLWGVPADRSHDGERGSCMGPDGPTGSLCRGAERPAPFLTNPTSCGGPLLTELRADAWENPLDVKTATFASHDALGAPVGIDGCDRLTFDPSVEVTAPPGAADSPIALGVRIQIPQDEDPTHLATPALRRAAIALPGGVAVNAAAANGLTACSEAQIEIHGGRPAGCPSSARIGSARIVTPLLDDPLTGSVFIARQGANPFGALLAVYLVASSDGVTVKLPGRIDADPGTGRLTATFDNSPQLPFSELEVEFLGGEGGVLTAPSRCGSYTARGEFTPWSGGSPVERSSAFAVDSGPTGSGCPGGAFAPTYSAGTISPTAGGPSSFVLNLSRDDGMQRLAGLTARLPRGVLARLAGIPYCPDAVLAALRTDPGSGAAELGSPSCLAASQVGVLAATAGVGPSPVFLGTGRVYLAGPYKGAPLSVAIVVPALAGPFDLGNVVVRAALRVDRRTAQIEAVSDPLPTMLAGIPLNLRELRLHLDRADFIRNPTSCMPATVDGAIGGSEGATAVVSVPFHASGCERLAFRPKLSMRVRGATKRSGYPALRATLSTVPGEANVGGVSVTLPPSEILAQNHLGSICARTQFDEGSVPGERCPKASIYGKARAFTSLLDKPLEGLVYLRPSGNPLPDLVATLNGQLGIVLEGRIDSVKGRIRVSFDTIPDAPISNFVLEMKGGRKGLLTNNRDLCATPNRAQVKLKGQNGKSVARRPLVASRCPKAKR